MFKRILVCLDGSDLAEQILPYAAEIASQFDSKIILVRVVDSADALTAVGESVFVSEKTIAGDIEGEGSKTGVYLEHVAQSLREKGLDVECLILRGASCEAIANYARKGDIDLIAITTRGRNSIGRLIFNGVTDLMLKKSGLPVLVTKAVGTENIAHPY